MPNSNPSSRDGAATRAFVHSRFPNGLADFAQRVVVAVLITVLILSVAYLLWRGTHVLLQAFAGVLFALFLSALSEWLSRRAGLSYGWALAIVTTAFLATAGVTGWLLA